MFPAATLFLDVCVQRDYWPAGAWPLMSGERGRNVARLFAFAATSSVRQGSMVCRHSTVDDAADGVPTHCDSPEAQERPDGCMPRTAAETAYVESGCRSLPDAGPYQPTFRHMTAGVRDAVVFGAGVEYALAHAVDALLRRRIRTHLVIDAVGAADDVTAQIVIAGWKRRGVDVATVDVVTRALTRS